MYVVLGLVCSVPGKARGCYRCLNTPEISGENWTNISKGSKLVLEKNCFQKMASTGLTVRHLLE